MANTPGRIALGIILIGIGLFFGLCWLLKEAHVTKKYVIPTLLVYPIVAALIGTYSFWWLTVPLITKTIVVSDINSGEWEGVAIGGKIALRDKPFHPALRSKFVKGKVYRFDPEISLSDREDIMAYGNLLLRFKDDVEPQFSSPNNWNKRESKKDGYAEYGKWLSVQVSYDQPLKIRDSISFKFPKPGPYDFEYEIVDAVGINKVNNQKSGVWVEGKFTIELYE